MYAGYRDLNSVIEEVKKLKWVELQFTDLMGYLRTVLVSSHLISAEVFNNGIGKLDGSSVKGFTGIEESDLNLKPDPATFALVPWSEGLGRFICDVYTASERFVKDPRLVAQRLDEMLGADGLKAFISSELEFFIFNEVRTFVDGWKQSFEIISNEGSWAGVAPFNKAKDGYYVPHPKDRFINLKMEIGDVLKKYFEIQVEVLHHEVAASSQHEINFKGGTATYVADAVQTVKHVIKSLAHKHGFIATFMPKLIYGDNGSGMHVHVSIWRGNENLFYDPNDSYASLSQFARYFIGGLIEHGRALSAIVSPTVNSYKRLVPGYEAPVYLVWSKANRSAAIRIPAYSNNHASKRVEYRPPDPSANPYLTFPAILLAGLDGVRRKIDPGDPVDENVYKMPPHKRRELGIKELPRSLEEALDELEVDNEWLRPVFSKELIETYIELKREEARKVNSYPTPVEIMMYYDV
jgi:glutamine synthetase